MRVAVGRSTERLQYCSTTHVRSRSLRLEHTEAQFHELRIWHCGYFMMIPGVSNPSDMLALLGDGSRRLRILAIRNGSSLHIFGSIVCECSTYSPNCIFNDIMNAHLIHEINPRVSLNKPIAVMLAFNLHISFFDHASVWLSSTRAVKGLHSGQRSR